MCLLGSMATPGGRYNTAAVHESDRHIGYRCVRVDSVSLFSLCYIGRYNTTAVHKSDRHIGVVVYVWIQSLCSVCMTIQGKESSSESPSPTMMAGRTMRDINRLGRGCCQRWRPQGYS
jgi:hypothetical protein